MNYLLIFCACAHCQVVPMVLICGSRWGTGLGRFIARYHWRALPLGHSLRLQKGLREMAVITALLGIFFLKNFIGSLINIFTIIILTNNWEKMHQF